MKILMGLLLTLFMFNASAAITCEIPTTANQTGIKLTMDESNITIEYLGETYQTPKIQSHVWDGHMSGIVTGDGYALSYEGHYGCMRNVRYTGRIQDSRRNIGTVTFDLCHGFSENEQFCR